MVGGVTMENGAIEARDGDTVKGFAYIPNYVRMRKFQRQVLLEMMN